MRVGIGYDLHRLVSGRDLVLGGVRIPFEKGLLGHSDADVLLHAVCDALLGAAGLGDIGLHFPDTDARYKDIASTELLGRTVLALRQKGFVVHNVDATLIAQAPKVAPFRVAMEKRIADVLEIDQGRVNVKATTTEGLGAIGRQEAMAAMCVATVEPMGDLEKQAR